MNQLQTLLPALCLLSLLACKPQTEAASEEPATAAAVESPEGAGLVIVNAPNAARPYFHDFGNIPWGTIVEHVFRVQNTDTVPITIKDLKPSCGCTVPSISYVGKDGIEIVGNTRDRKKVLTLPPGAVADLRMRIDSRKVTKPNYDKLAQVRLRSDAKNNAFISFEMHVVVDLLFQATPLKIELGQVAQSAGKRKATEIVVARPGGAARILDVRTHDPNIEVELEESVRFGQTLWTVTARIPPGTPLGPYSSDIILETTEANGEGSTGSFNIPVLAQVVEDIVLRPANVFLGSFQRTTGSRAEARVEALVPGHKISVIDYHLKGEGTDDMEVEVVAVDADEEGKSGEWLVVLKVPENAPSDVYSGRLTLSLDDPQFSQFDVPFSGRVNE